MEALFVYVTAKNVEEARFIAKTVVDERLAACANLLGGVESIYRWQGKICEDRETAMILKTTAELQDALTQRIKALHSYECPCVVCLPITGGNPAFLQWIGDNTGEE